MSNLKLGPIADDKPVRITVRLSAELHRMLLDYTEMYGKQSGQVIPVDRLVPAMLERFMVSDRGFRKERGRLTRRMETTRA